MFNSMYQAYADERSVFGSHWCGQEQLQHGEDVLVAKYPKDKDGDGQSVDVFCCAMPARFYTLVVSPDPDSLGRHQEGYKISTGSSCHELAAKLAEAIAGGMVGFAPANTACSGQEPA